MSVAFKGLKDLNSYQLCTGRTYSKIRKNRIRCMNNQQGPRCVTAAKFDKCKKRFLSIFIAPKFTIGLIIRYASLNIIEKIIIPKPKIFTGTRIQDSFRVYNLCSCHLPAETNNFVLGSVLLFRLSYRSTETIFTGTRTQDRFSGFMASAL
jgi:hypothetical protein